MAMAVNNQQNEPPHEDLLRITFKGLSWAENICQTVEKIYTESKIVKKSCKYVDAVGEQLKNILDAVVNDYDNPDDDDPVPDDLFKSCEKGGTKLDGNHEIALDGKISHCGNCELDTSCVEGLPLKQDNAVNITKKSANIPKLACNKLEKTVDSDDGAALEDRTVSKISNCDYVEDLQAKLPNKSVSLIEEDASTGKCKTAQDGLNFSVSRKTSHEDFLHGTVFAADWTDSVPFSSQSLSSISHQTIYTGEQSSCQPVLVDSNLKETLCILESEESEYALKIGHERTGTCVFSPKCACQENLNSFSREKDHKNHSVFSIENDDMNEFEDETLDNNSEEVKIGNCLDNTLKYKIGGNSSQTNKSIPYKKLLKRMLLSRFWSSRDSEQVKYHDDLCSMPSLDSDWELIETCK